MLFYIIKIYCNYCSTNCLLYKNELITLPLDGSLRRVPTLYGQIFVISKGTLPPLVTHCSYLTNSYPLTSPSRDITDIFLLMAIDGYMFRKIE